MEIKGEFTFKLPQKTVWDVLRDPKVLALIIPICRDVKQVTDTTYTGVLFFKAGNIAGTFRGEIELCNIQAPDSYDIKVKGESTVGVVNITGNMYLESDDEKTVMHYGGTVQFGGRIASVGSRLLDMAVRSMMQQSFDTLHRYLLARPSS